jgi:hypothetical protein
MTARLLCRDCEQRFSKFGENWVLAHCLHKDRSFLLAAILASRTPDISSDKTTTRLFYAAKIPEIDISALAYFATSIFWRGSIHPWNDDGSIPVMLGPFQEQFRQYLLGLLPFPKDCSLSVVVREGKEIDRLTYAPIVQTRRKFSRLQIPHARHRILNSCEQEYSAELPREMLRSRSWKPYCCNDAYRRIPHGRRDQDGSGETRRSLKLKDYTATTRQLIHAVYKQSSAASAIGRAARCSDNLHLDLSPQEALYLRSKCAHSEDRQTDGLCVCRSIPSQF